MAKDEKKTVAQEDEEKDLEPEIEEEETDLESDEDDAEDPSEEDEGGDESEEEELDDKKKLAKAEAKAAKYRRLFQKARQHSKASKPEKPEPKSPTPPAVDVDERILLSQGMSKDLLKELKDVARLRGVSLIEAQSDKLFIGIKDEYEKDQRRKAASLPASRGSGSSKPKKSLTTPGLSRDEHKALMREAASN